MGRPIRAAAMAVVVALAGCVGGRLLNTNTMADAGPPPSNTEASVRAHLQRTLLDPYSVMDLSISQPILTNCAIGIYGPFHAWRSTVTYNAKNAYGAYTGLKTYYFWFHGDRLKGINQDAAICSEAAGWLN